MKLSVIVPVYNAAPYLRECLASVALPGVEVIAVDDGSTDGSGAILDAFPGVTVLHRENAGAWSARNAGIEASHGDWLLFVDADDVLAEGWTSVVSDMVARFPDADMAGFARSDVLPLAPCAPAAIREMNVGEVVGSVFFFDGMWQYAYRRALIGDVRFRRIYRVEDKVFQSALLARAKIVVRSDAVVYGYRQHAASIMHQAWSEKNFGPELRMRILWLENILGAGKRMDAWSMRFIGLHCLEYHPYIIRQVPRGALRDRLTELWFDSLRDASRMPFAPYQRFAIGLLAKTRSRLFAECLCHFPFALKRFLGRGRK